MQTPLTCMLPHAADIAAALQQPVSSAVDTGHLGPHLGRCCRRGLCLCSVLGPAVAWPMQHSSGSSSLLHCVWGNWPASMLRLDAVPAVWGAVHACGRYVDDVPCRETASPLSWRDMP